MAKTGNISEGVLQKLAEKLPPGWRITEAGRADSHGPRAPSRDSILKIRAPSGKFGCVLVETQRRLEPKDVDFLTPTPGHKLPLLIVAPFISGRTQDRLKARGIGYADPTGNIYLSIPEPGLFIETTGAVRNPAPTSRERKSLKGAKAGRLIRALCDFRPPIGIRELAKRAGIDAGYTSRLVDFLEREALIRREGRGPIVSTDWVGLIRQWSKEYSPFKQATWYLAPRGIAAVLEHLKGLRVQHVVSGSWAAAQFAPVSPTRLLLCYADEFSDVIRALDLRPTEAGANIALATPFDPVVYERTSSKNGITITAASQIATDLLGSPGRGPSEAEALIEWMHSNEHVWRT